jgi:simple sugar transport system ATP-binding protein
MCRRFGRRAAADGIDLELRQGDIVALLGDNGSGKATLLNLLAGYEVADGGEVRILNTRGKLRRLHLGSVRVAIKAGIGLVRSQPALAPSLTALENMLIGKRSMWWPGLARRRARAQLSARMRELGFRVDLDIPAGQLPVGDQLRVELIRALDRRARILLLDQPTAVLTRQESESLFTNLRTLAAAGLAVIFTTRKIDEAMAWASRIAVLREGRKVADDPAGECDRAMLAVRMTRRLIPRHALGPQQAGQPVLEFSKVDAAGRDERSSLRQVSFEVRAGETIGIAGIAGNGKNTLAAIVGGLAAPTGGTVRLFGLPVRRFSVADFIEAGVGRIPADRRRDGVVADMSIAENLAIEDFGQPWFQRYGLLRRRGIRAHAGELAAAFRLGHLRLSSPTASLSHGKLQRCIVARILNRRPLLVLAHQPTRGLDSATTSEIHRTLIALRAGGTAILLVSEDVDELLMLSDFIGVLHQGRLTVPQPSAAFDARSLGAMMGGQGSMALDWAGWGGAT